MSLKIDIHHKHDNFQLSIETVIQPSKITAIIGDSGSGKTSLLNCIAGLYHHQGSIQYKGQIWQKDNHTHIKTEQRGIGFINQDNDLFPHLSCEQHIQLAWQHRFNKTINLNLEKLISDFGLQSQKEAYPHQLSGGQKQRLKIIRSISNTPQLMLLDEPFNGLDENNKQLIIQQLLLYKEQLQFGILLVSHNTHEIALMAEELLVIKNGLCIKQESTATLLSDPQFNQNRANKPSVIHATIENSLDEYQLYQCKLNSGDSLFIPIADNRKTLPNNSDIKLTFSANAISISLNKETQNSILNRLYCCIMQIHIENNKATIQLKNGDQCFLASITLKSLDDLDLSVGQMVYAQIKSVSLITTGNKHHE